MNIFCSSIGGRGAQTTFAKRGVPLSHLEQTSQVCIAFTVEKKKILFFFSEFQTSLSPSFRKIELLKKKNN